MNVPQFHFFDPQLSGDPGDPLRFASWIALALALFALALAGWVVAMFA